MTERKETFDFLTGRFSQFLRQQEVEVEWISKEDSGLGRASEVGKIMGKEERLDPRVIKELIAQALKPVHTAGSSPSTILGKDLLKEPVLTQFEEKGGVRPKKEEDRSVFVSQLLAAIEKEFANDHFSLATGVSGNIETVAIYFHPNQGFSTDKGFGGQVALHQLLVISQKRT